MKWKEFKEMNGFGRNQNQSEPIGINRNQSESIGMNQNESEKNRMKWIETERILEQKISHLVAQF